MAASIQWNGHGRVSPLDTLTSVAATKLTGTGGAPSAAIADGQIEGSGAVTCVCSRQRVALTYDIGAGNTLNFDVAGAENGQMIYVWGNFLAAALLNIQAAGGFGIIISSGGVATDYRMYYFYGSDNYPGGWQRMIIDPTLPASGASGSTDLASIRYIGIFGDVGNNTARFDNLILDAIDVGFGIKVHGTSTVDDLFGDILSDEQINRLGVVTSLNTSNTAIELKGQIQLGDKSGSSSSDLSDIDKSIYLAEPTYYDGSSVSNSVPISFFKIEMVSNPTTTTQIQFGKKVGSGDTANGRNGLTFLGNDTYDLSIDFDDGLVDSVLIYGTTFRKIKGSITWGSNNSHEYIGSTFDQCEQVDIGSAQVRNTTFSNYSGANGALLWSAVIDVKNCNFINNNFAIDHPDIGSTFVYDGLLSIGNNVDANNTSLGAVEVNAVNGTTMSTANSVGVTITNSRTLTLTGLYNPTKVYLVNKDLPESDPSYVIDSQVITAGEYVHQFSSGININALYRLIALQRVVLEQDISLGTTNITIPINQQLDRVYENN